eukprot:2346208-Rhodomonas_salina.1
MPHIPVLYISHVRRVGGRWPPSSTLQLPGYQGTVNTTDHSTSIVETMSLVGIPRYVPGTPVPGAGTPPRRIRS